MGLSLDSISQQATVRAPRIVLLGVEKIGKTSWSCGCTFEGTRLVEQGINSPIVLPIRGEEGVDDLNVASFPTLNSSDEVLEAIGVLYEDKHEYRTVVIDSASALEPVVWDDLCRRSNVKSIEKIGGGYGKGYLESMDVFRQILSGLDALRRHRNMSSIIIGHVKVKRFDDPCGDSFDRYFFDVHDRVSSLMFRWADLVLFADTKTVVKKEDVGFNQKHAIGIDIAGGKRFLFTQHRPAHPGGGRGVYGRLPYELPLDWRAFENAVANAIDNNA